MPLVAIAARGIYLFGILSDTEGGIGTTAAAVSVVGGGEGKVVIVDVVDGLSEPFDEVLGVCGDVSDGFAADDERGIVALGTGMLDEEQGGAHGLRLIQADDVAVEEGLKVVVAVVGNLGRVEDGVDVGHGPEVAGAGLVVDDADAVEACLWVDNAVETVDVAADDGAAPRHFYALLEAEDGEGRQSAVGLDEQPHVSDNDLAVDELKAVEIK